MFSGVGVNYLYKSLMLYKKIWVLYSLLTETLCYELSVCYVPIVVDLICMVQRLLKKSMHLNISLSSIMNSRISIFVHVSLAGFVTPWPYFCGQWSMLVFLCFDVFFLNTVSSRSIFGVWKIVRVHVCSEGITRPCLNFFIVQWSIFSAFFSVCFAYTTSSMPAIVVVWNCCWRYMSVWQVSFYLKLIFVLHW